MKHTPGPWKVHGTLAEGKFVFITTEADESVDICHVCIWPERKANAHLIAAAPELLSAAKDALRTLTVADEIESDKRQSRRLLEAAIAKAEEKDSL